MKLDKFEIFLISLGILWFALVVLQVLGGGSVNQNNNDLLLGIAIGHGFGG